MKTQPQVKAAPTPKRVQTTAAIIKTLASFCREVGINPITAWRMRRKGWLKTVNIAGRQYVTAEAQMEFSRRASAGEFAQEHKVPTR